ncbi:MAG: YihY/virulence factor BrkB family protein [Boseongicola sp.]|nr:YihY/virulence factor BrkB family protein [Boseongicola sp.]
MTASPNTSGHGAERPRDIPFLGWKQILLRAWKEGGRDHVSLIAAGVAFYGLLALFPAITALMAISGLIFDPQQITGQMEILSSMMPEAAVDIILGQAVEIAGSQEGGLGLAALIGIGIALYSASKGVGSLMEGVNIAYDEKETRGFVRLTATKLALTLFLIFGMSAGLGATLVLPGVLSLVDLGATTEALIGVARWGVLLVATILGILVLFRYAPDREPATWTWLLPGAVFACIVWLVASIAFAVYVENFGSYNESFGALAGVVILLMWLWISAYVLLFGAEVNAETEAQVRKDTTTGPDMPRGARGAVKADELAGVSSSQN